MSAYALSGSLFPSIGPLSSCSSSNSCPSKQGVSPSVNVPVRDTIDSVIAQTKETKDDTGSSEVGIAVKAARIDPMSIVRHATGRGKFCQQAKKAVANRIRRRTSLQDPVLDSSLVSQDQHIRRSNSAVRVTGPSTPQMKACDITEPHKDAIQFELCISLNGRSYSATRTLPRIIELRDELIRELDRRRKGYRLGGMGRGKNSTSPPPPSICRDDDTVETMDEFTDLDLDQDLDVTIPELPDCIADNVETATVGGFGNRGFRFLQAVIHSYCPAIERWLRHVADLVPPNSSPCLMDFLWEPLSPDWDPEVSEGGLKKHESVSTQLDSIDESSSESEEDDN